MKTRLAYTQFSFMQNMISFVGDKDAIKDLDNYLTLHLPNDISMTAIEERIKNHEIYVFIYKIDKHAKLWMYNMLRSKFKKKTGKLITERDYKVAMMCLEEEIIAKPNGVSHSEVVEFMETSMWRSFITEFEPIDFADDETANDWDPEEYMLSHLPLEDINNNEDKNED